MRNNAACVVVVACLLIFANLRAFGQTNPERAILAATNAVRTQRGLQPLAWDNALAAAAQAHAEVMAQQAQLSHQYQGEDPIDARASQAGAHFDSIAENIALAPDVETLQAEWMKSTPHRTNILDPTFTAIGVAVVSAHGELYAVVDFARSVKSLTREQVEQEVSALLVKRGIQVTGPKHDARQTCEMEHGGAGGSEPLFRMRWQTSDLTRLPPALDAQLNNRQYRSAAVGACSSAGTQAMFTTFRVAVLLF